MLDPATELLPPPSSPTSSSISSSDLDTEVTLSPSTNSNPLILLPKVSFFPPIHLIFFLGFRFHSLRDPSSMTEAPHSALLWVSASRRLPSEPPTATHIQPSPPLPPPWTAPRGLPSLGRRRPSWRRSGGGSGGGCVGMATRGRLL